MPNCSQFSSQRLVAGRILKQLVWWFWVALDSIMQQSALLMVSPICFYSSPVQENLYSFIHSRVKPWIKSPMRLTWQLFYSPKMSTDHIPVLNHTLFSLCTYACDPCSVDAAVDVTGIMAITVVSAIASNEGEEEYCPCKQ